MRLRRATRGRYNVGANSKPVYPGSSRDPEKSSDDGQFRSDRNQGGWQDADGFTLGAGHDPQVLAVNGYATASADIGLQAAVANDHASIYISLANIANLDGFANAGATGTVTSAASAQGLLTLTNGNLTGTYTASLSIDITAYLAADNATVHMQITDSFQLSLSGTGYVGASLAETSTSGGTVTAMTPSGSGSSGPARGQGGTFDLARFAASVLNIGQWNIAFVATAPGESIKGVGSSVMTINAVAELATGQRPEVLNFHDTERSNLTFADTSSPSAGAPWGIQDSVSAPVNLFHTA
jgi:hypothetical protein